MPKPQVTATEELALLKQLAEQHLKGLTGSYQFWEIVYEQQANLVRAGTTLTKTGQELYTQASEKMQSLRADIELAEAALRRVQS